MFGKKMQLILGNKGAMKEFMPIFEWVERKGIGKLVSSHCMVPTSVAVEPTKEVYERFNKLQDEASAQGLEYNCFCLNI